MIGTVKIGWDWDDIIFPWYHLAHQVSLAAGIALPEHEPTSWAPYEHYGCTPDEWYAVLDKEVIKGADGMYLHPLEDDNKWQLHRAASAGFENHVVTARGSFGTLGHHVKELTRTQIDREGVPVRSLTFSKKKSDVVNDLGLQYFIDDAPHNYIDLVDNTNADIYLLDQPWNQDCKVATGHRLFSVEEYVDIILRKHATVSV